MIRIRNIMVATKYIVFFGTLALITIAILVIKTTGTGNNQETVEAETAVAQEDSLPPPPAQTQIVPAGLVYDRRSCGQGDVMKKSLKWKNMIPCEPNSSERDAFYGGGKRDCGCESPNVVQGNNSMSTYHKNW